MHVALAFSQLNLCFKTIIRISKGEALYFFFFLIAKQEVHF